MLLKICGLTNLDDLRAAEAAGADYTGVVFIPGTPRAVSIKTAKRLIDAARGKKVCVVRNMAVADLNELIAKLHPDVIQLHGEESPEYAAGIRGAEVWKAVKLNSETALEYAVSFPCTMIVADSGGGTGQLCRWDLARKLAGIRRVMLAGGITPQNVRDAIRQVQPAGIDISGGVEKEKGLKDHSKIKLLTERMKR